MGRYNGEDYSNYKMIHFLAKFKVTIDKMSRYNHTARKDFTNVVLVGDDHTMKFNIVDIETQYLLGVVWAFDDISIESKNLDEVLNNPLVKLIV